jgi:hypothetical protein
VYIFLMFLYIINFGFPLQASRDIRVDRKVALTIISSRKKNQDEDSTDSISDGGDSSPLPIDPSTGPLEGAQFVDNTTLTQPSESPISQVPSLASNLAATILSESAVLEHEQLISLSPNAVDTSMAVDSNIPALLSHEDGTIPYHDEPLPDIF